MNNLLSKLHLTSNPNEVCKVLMDECFSDVSLSEEQFNVLIEIFGEPDLASYALLYLTTIFLLEDSLELSEIYKVVYKKFGLSSSLGVTDVLTTSIIA
jgi:hypothetical protein